MSGGRQSGSPPGPGRAGPVTPRRLLFAGEAIVDVVMRVPALPRRGGDMLAESAMVTAGGGFNVMAAAARQGLPVAYAGGHGTGPWGDVIRAALAAEGITPLRLPDTSRDTGFDVALVEPDAERSFVTRLGAETLRDAGSWDRVRADPGDAVYVSGYGLADPQAGPALSRWAAALPPGVLLFFDPGPLVAQLPPEALGPVLTRCDWMSANEREAAILAAPWLTEADGAALSPVEAARRLLGWAGQAGVLVRAGAAGCYLALRSPEAAGLDGAPADDFGLPDALLAEPVHVPAPTVTAVDSTGAGDAHAGVFLAALADGLPPLDAAARANAAAAFAVTRDGPATAPARAELDAWLAR